MDRKKVVLGISGGVDSSTSAYMLQQEGYEVIGVTLICSEEQKKSQDLIDARNLTKKLKIRHFELDIIDEFREKIIKYFIDEYSKGLTPSPCVVCDEIIKMKKLIDIANENNAYYIATGHYCKISKENIFNKTLLMKPKDEKKDQGYMLYRVKSEILSRLIFPLAKYEKVLVREKAKEYNIEIHDKKDSQGICFAKEGYIDFLKKHLKDKVKKGYYKDEQGNILGEHQGYQLYTIGQRRGLGVLFSKIYFIIDIIPESNEIILGDYDKLNKKRIELNDFVLHVDFNDVENLILIGKPRFSSLGLEGKLIKENNKIYFEYEKENPQNSRGQHLVIYYKDLVIGGGKIIF